MKRKSHDIYQEFLKDAATYYKGPECNISVIRNVCFIFVKIFSKCFKISVILEILVDDNMLQRTDVVTFKFMSTERWFVFLQTWEKLFAI